MKERIVILGGGIAAMTTAFELTSRPGWKDCYEVDVYQMGWRLGGKGASGRNAEHGQRVEEHGLHILLGFYENAFAMMSACYAELGRAPDAPLPTWKDALLPQNSFVMEQHTEDRWNHWPMIFPSNEDFPGDGKELPSPVQYLLMIAKAVVEIAGDLAKLGVQTGLDLVGLGPDDRKLSPQVRVKLASGQLPGGFAFSDTTGVPGASGTGAASSSTGSASKTSDTSAKSTRRRDRVLAAAKQAFRAVRGLPEDAVGQVKEAAQHIRDEGVMEHLKESVEHLKEDVEQLREDVASASGALSLGSLIAKLLSAAEGLATASDHSAALGELEKLVASALDALDQNVLATLRGVAPDVERSVHAIALGLVTIRGMIVDGLVTEDPDWASIDHLELRDWFRQHGASEASINSPLVQAGYDLIFANSRAMAAGVGLYGALRMFFTYKGSCAFRMRAGMGDTIFAPLYLVLKARGVRFHFFHRVDEIIPSDDGTQIDSIRMGQQVTLKNGEFNPLVDVKGLPCWPSLPDYDQLVEGEALKASGENLENWWTRWTDSGAVTLERSKDFDKVVLAISIGAFRYIAKRLIDQDQAFGDMVRGMTTTNTQAAQLWFRPDTAAMGWTLLDLPTVGTYIEPMDTWADMSHLLPMEDWPSDDAPHSVAYLCGGLADRFDENPPPRTAHDYPFRVKEQVRRNTLSWLNTASGHLWPNSTQSNNPRALNPAHLFVSGSIVPPTDVYSTQNGGISLQGQYWTANWNPSDRYNLSPVNTTKTRLKANGTGYKNLVLAGDWTWNLVNAGCVEAAATSGMLASKAICGWPIKVVGLSDARIADIGPTPFVPLPEPALTRALLPYLASPGDSVLTQPFGFVGCYTCNFILRADATKLQALVDRMWNEPRGISDKQYRIVGPFVVNTWVHIDEARSVAPGFEDSGWLSEEDAVFAIPLTEGTVRDGEYVVESFLFGLPFVWATNPEAVVQGREIWGYLKTQGEINREGELRSPKRLHVRADSVKPGNNGVRLLNCDICRVELNGDAAAPQLIRGLADAVELFARLLPELGLGVVKQMLSELSMGTVPSVFLKQFPDVVRNGKACYQSVLTSSQLITKLVGVGFIDGDYSVYINESDPADLLSALGLQGSSDGAGSLVCKPVAQMYGDYDFVIAYGSVKSETLSLALRDDYTADSPVELPHFVSVPNRLNYSLPIAITGRQTDFYVLAADMATLTSLIESYYNESRPVPRVVFRPLAPRVLLMRARAMRDGRPTTDVHLLVPLIRTDPPTADAPARNSLALGTLFAWCDQAEIVVNSRECWGSVFQFAESITADEGGAGFTVKTLVDCARDNGADGARNVLRLRQVEAAAAAAWPDVGVAAQDLAALLPEGGGAERALLEQVLGDGAIPEVFVKQFRDVRDGTRACYQSVLTCVHSFSELSAAGPLSGRYELVVHDFPNMSIFGGLGLQGSQPSQGVMVVPVLGAFQFSSNLMFSAGDILWEAR